MKFLIDTNIIIPLEPTDGSNIEPGSYSAIDLVRLISEGNHQIYIHPASLADLAKDKNKDRREARNLLVKKYPLLPNPPSPSDNMKTILGSFPLGSNDAIDITLLASVESDAVDFFVTSDVGIHKKARRIGLGQRVALPGEAIDLIESLFPITPLPPPAVHYMLAHELNINDPIFESFRSNYPEFDKWLAKCRKEHRDCWVIQIGQEYRGIAIIKAEDQGEYGLDGPILKLCSFKISENSRGASLGELLLKAIFEYAVRNNFKYLYFETFEQQRELILLAETFGFKIHNELSTKGEMVMIKTISPSTEDQTKLSPLDYHIAFGPHYFKPSGVEAFAVPIQPHFHHLLFPDVDIQRQLFPGENSYGNSIRKAYLCNAPIRRIEPGDLLFFYHSRTTKGVTCLGVVEQTLVSSNPDEIVRFVGKRTVYSFPQIRLLCESPVLALLFRHSRSFSQPIHMQTLFRNGVLSGPPQSIVTIPQEAVPWLIQKLEL